MTTLTIRIPDTLRKELKSLSRSENKAVSDIVRESIRKHVALERFKALRSKVLPFAEAQGILTDEDVFNALK
jgi:predicted transcriptional regulator